MYLIIRAIRPRSARRLLRCNVHSYWKKHEGYKKHHALKYLAVTMPDGIIAVLHVSHKHISCLNLLLQGPESPNHSDGYLISRSGLRHSLRAMNANRPPGDPLRLFGDKGAGSPSVVCYVLEGTTLSAHILRPHMRPRDRAEGRFNRSCR